MAIHRRFSVFLLVPIAAIVLVVYYVTSERGYEACHNMGFCTRPIRRCDQCSQYLFNDLNKLKPKNDICREGFATVLVVSHPGNIGRRRTLRPMLRDPNLHGGKRLNYVFVMGSSPAGAENNLLKKENDEHGDILQFSFLDVHHNAALLSTLSFSHVVERCSRLNENGVDFIFKVEDHSYINFAKLTQQVAKFSPTERFVGGYCKVSKPERNINDMAFVGDDVYPGEYFPVSCAKHAYVASYKAMADIIKTAPSVPAVHLEEVYITGLCRAAANVKFVNLEGFNWPQEPTECDFETNVVAYDHVEIEDQSKFVERLMQKRPVSTQCYLGALLTPLNVVFLVIILLIGARIAFKICGRNLRR